ncbi:hypothetical protein [Yinghuangia soli]|uniref:Uncharacterized protein n=1 Tax=Yinghuangia soli TaxID=2908204 RepID=A0AA41PUN6_9ACTN|nr:hypothetical protein [Yinghuangia soli]MCF2526068.1 hypothetical protein [Yinghuangia soli]
MNIPRAGVAEVPATAEPTEPAAPGQPAKTAAWHAKRIRIWLAAFIVGLVLSGVTAFPMETEMRVLVDVLHRFDWVPDPLVRWIDRSYEGVVVTNDRYPFMAYGTDWLAFAHLTIAVAFWGPWKDPIRNVWVVQWGLIACAAIIPLALICGPLRDIPLWWRFIDMSFGVFGAVPLLIVLRHIRRLEALTTAAPQVNRLTESIK